MRSFTALCANKHQDLPTPAMLFITKASYNENFRLVFGYDYALIRIRMWEILSDFCKLTRVSFFNFVDKLGNFMGGRVKHEAALVF